MPRQVEARAEEDAEHGSTAELQRLEDEGAAPAAPGPARPAEEGDLGLEEVADEELDFGIGEEEDDDLEPEGEIEKLLFGDPPDDDIPTSGMPFGAGPDTVRPPGMSDQQFFGRVLRTLAGSSDPTAQRFARRTQREIFGLQPDEGP